MRHLPDEKATKQTSIVLRARMQAFPVGTACTEGYLISEERVQKAS